MTPARVLLVEDERIVALHLRQQLGKLGYAVAAVAASGDEALRQIEAQHPDVVLMDIHIEGPIDGIETTARMAADPRIPVIYLTAYAEDTTLERARATRPYGYLLKPFSERELHATIQMALARSTVDAMVRTNEQRLELLVKQRTEALEREIAERQRTEQALRQSQKLEAIGQLTSGIAHDFNNLLTVVLGSLALLERRVRDESCERLITAALEATQRGATLTRQLLSFGRRQMVQPVSRNINNILFGCSEIIRSGVGPMIDVDYRLQENRAVCHIDCDEFERVILNLAINARQAMPDGGSLTIETDTLQIASSADGENLAAGDYIRVALRDTGHGMTPEVLARAFDPFFTTREVGQGSGLGLSQTYGFAKQCGGHVTIESAVGDGTRVVLYLPVVEAPRAAVTTPPSPVDMHAAVVVEPPPRASGRLAC
jgi:signal transduction histidine kinase